MSQDVDDDFILFVVLISCIIASHLFYTNFSYLNYSLHYILDGLFPATYNSKRGEGVRQVQSVIPTTRVLLSLRRISFRSQSRGASMLSTARTNCVS